METIHTTLNKSANKQKGFTLVEIAIVLVIIGLLLGGVLKGQELIKGAKVKAAAGDVNAYSVALLGYQDRYGDLFTNGNTNGAYAAGATPVSTATDTTAKSTAMLTELAARGFVASKTQHALGGNIVLIKNGQFATTPADGTLGSGNLANNASTTPTTFNWAVCYTGLTTAEDAQGLIRAIDGSTVTFPAAYREGRARLVVNDTFASAADITHGTNNSTVCFEL